MKIFNIKVLIFALALSFVLGTSIGPASAQETTTTTANTANAAATSTDSDIDPTTGLPYTDSDLFAKNLMKQGETPEAAAKRNELMTQQVDLYNTYKTDKEELLRQRDEIIRNQMNAASGQSDDSLAEIETKIAELDAEFINSKNVLIDQLAATEKDGDRYEYRDPKTGKVTYFEKKGDSYVSVSGASEGCVPLPAKVAEAKSCIFCPLFTIIFNTAQQMATAAYSSLSFPMAQVMVLGFAIWVAFKVLLQVSSFTKQDGPKFITELLIQGFKILVAFVLLAGSSGVFTYIVGPMLSTGLEFGTAMLFDIGDTFDAERCRVTSNVVSEPGVLPSYLHENLLCFIKAVQQEIALMQAISTSLMCIGTEEASGAIGGFITWDYSMIFQGLVTFVFSWLIMLAFAFYLLDATVRLGIVGTLIPFLIACWPFNVTRKYTTAGWTMFMNTFFTYVFVGLVIMVNIKLAGQALSGGKGGVEAIQDAINGDNVQTLKDLLDIGFAGFLILIGCCIFGFKLSAQASELAGSMAGGGTPIGSRIGGMMASAATTVGKGLAKTGKKIAWDSETSHRIRGKAWNATKKRLGTAAKWTGKVTGITAGAQALNKARKTAGRAIKDAAIGGAVGLNNARKTAGRNIKNSVKQGWEDIKNNEGPKGSGGMTPTGMMPITPAQPAKPENEQTPSNNNDQTPNTQTPPNTPTPPNEPNTQTPSNDQGGDNKSFDEIKAQIAAIKAQIDELKGSRSNPIKGKDIASNMKKVQGLEQQMRELQAKLKDIPKSDGGDERKDADKPNEGDSGDRKPDAANPNPANKGGDKGGSDAPVTKTFNEMNEGERAAFVQQATEEFEESAGPRPSSRMPEYAGRMNALSGIEERQSKEYEKKRDEFERRDRLSPENGGFANENARNMYKQDVDNARAALQETRQEIVGVGNLAAAANRGDPKWEADRKAYVQEKINELNNKSPDANEKETAQEKTEADNRVREAEEKAKEAEARLQENENKLKDVEAKIQEAEAQLKEAESKAKEEAKENEKEKEKDPAADYMKSTKYKDKYEEAKAKADKLKRDKAALQGEKHHLANQRDEAGARAAEASIKAGEASKDLSREQNKGSGETPAKNPEIKEVPGETKIEIREVPGQSSRGDTGGDTSSRTGGSGPQTKGNTTKPDSK